jgi:hypothetical protein
MHAGIGSSIGGKGAAFNGGGIFPITNLPENTARLFGEVPLFKQKRNGSFKRHNMTNSDKFCHFCVLRRRIQKKGFEYLTERLRYRDPAAAFPAKNTFRIVLDHLFERQSFSQIPGNFGVNPDHQTVGDHIQKVEIPVENEFEGAQLVLMFQVKRKHLCMNQALV